MVNLCRDEVTVTLKQKIDAVFGASFSTNGLGGVLTCGAVGMGAGFSHSPVCDTTGKERYVFFSFPHISINSKGEVGPMSRPGRPGQSCACGALIKSWNELRSEGVTCNCKIPGGERGRRDGGGSLLPLLPARPPARKAAGCLPARPPKSPALTLTPPPALPGLQCTTPLTPSTPS